MTQPLVELGLMAVSGSAVSALLSKFKSIEEIRLTNPALYAMLVAGGAAVANEMRRENDEQQVQNNGLSIPGYMV
jgi:phospholipase/lecithinase/hemolysin